MLILGIILLVVGGIMALFGRREGEPLMVYGGLIIFVGGVIVFVIAILDASGADVNTHAAIVGGLAMTIPPPVGHSRGGAGKGEAIVPVAGTVREQPVLVAFGVAAVPIVAAFILQILDASGTATPLWLRTALTGAGALIGALAAAWARAQVTPTAAPRLDEGTPLVPMVESEHV